VLYPNWFTHFALLSKLYKLPNVFYVISLNVATMTFHFYHFLLLLPTYQSPIGFAIS